MSDNYQTLKWQMGDAWYALIAESFKECKQAARMARNDPEGKLYDEWFDEIRLFAMSCKNLFGKKDWEEYVTEEKKLRTTMGMDATGVFSLTLGKDKHLRAKVHDGCHDLMNWIVRKAHENRLLIPTAYHNPHNPGIGA